MLSDRLRNCFKKGSDPLQPVECGVFEAAPKGSDPFLKRLLRVSCLGSGILMLAMCGCETAKPTVESSSSARAGASNDQSEATPAKPPAGLSPAGAASSQTAQLEPGSVNEQGLIVLHSDPLPESAETLPDSAAVLPDSAAPTDSAEATPATATSTNKSLSPEANVASDAERNQKIAEDWPKPQAVLFISGQQHGYLEPCGCTGLDKQKGGLIRRDTLLTSLRERGWDIVPLDVGNQVRRIGRQPEIKFQTTVAAFKTMDYAAATFGIDDLKLSSVELIQAASADDDTQCTFVSANVSILDPSFFPDSKIVEVGGRKIGITAIMGAELKQDIQSSDVEFSDPIEKLKPVIAKLKSENCDFIVLLAHASLEESAAVARAVEGIDLVVTAGGFGEPTLEPQPIADSRAVMVQVGTKGMYGGIVGLFDDPQHPIRYQKIAISSQFKDSPRMLDDFAVYQKRLEDAGFDGLGVTPTPHPSGREFVGSESCADCHSTAFEIWENTPHHHATESIVNPPNDRGGIQRHFDPECVSCHVTGWKPQEFAPYTSGYASLAKSELMLGSGCENCHGPGSEHVAAENGDIDVDNEKLLELRQQMILPLDRARDKCIECHDLDNSPDFLAEGAFEEYWEQVKHYGKD